jgi:DNA-binding IclR family transcriptional regulator
MATIAKTADEDQDRDGTIRAIGRGLRVLQAINRGGSITMMQICRQAEIPYPTACRIIETLIKEGMVEREPARKRYRATALVRTLSLGFQDEDALVAVARPHIVALCARHGWPVTLATRVGHSMMVRDSTHKLTSLTLANYSPGYTLPIVECSTGKAYLAFCDEESARRSWRAAADRWTCRAAGRPAPARRHDAASDPGGRVRDAGAQRLHGRAGQDVVDCGPHHQGRKGPRRHRAHLLRRGHADGARRRTLCGGPASDRPRDRGRPLRTNSLHHYPLGGEFVRVSDGKATRAHSTGSHDAARACRVATTAGKGRLGSWSTTDCMPFASCSPPLRH